ncbi:MAG: hypothetical protein H0U59_00875 [Gemmatimonadaceae bacterium]|nr:hypothetical protein [Gemmatimonadaceae bacterium]
MPDHPASPELKLFIRAQQAREFGKEFDEVRERQVLGLPEATDHPPIFIAERPERKQMVIQEDVQGMRELEAAANATGAAQQIQDVATLRAALADRDRQIAELKGEPAAITPGPQPEAPTKETETVAKTVPTGSGPSEDWTARQLRQFAEEKGISLPKALASASKRQILEHILKAQEAKG